MARRTQETAETLARQIQTMARENISGFRNRKPSSIYIHSDALQGIQIRDVLSILNPPLLARVGITFWQADVSSETFSETVFASLMEQTDARPGATFSRSELYSRFQKIFSRRRKENGLHNMR